MEAPKFEDTLPIDEAPPKFEDTVPAEEGFGSKVMGAAKKVGGAVMDYAVNPMRKGLAISDELAGESIRTGVEYLSSKTNLPYDKADREGFRPPTAVQDYTGKRTAKPPASFVGKSYEGWQGVSAAIAAPMRQLFGEKNVGSPLEEASKEIERPKNTILDVAGQIGYGIMLGRAGTVPFEAVAEGIRIPVNFGIQKIGPSVKNSLPNAMARLGLNRTASEIVVKEPEILTNKDVGTIPSIEKASQNASDTIQNHVAGQRKVVDKLKQEQADISLVSQRVTSSDLEKTRIGLEEAKKHAQDLLLEARNEKGVAIGFEQRSDLIQNPSLPKTRKLPVQQIINDATELKKSIGKMTPRESIGNIFDLKSQIESHLTSSATSEEEKQILAVYHNNLNELFNRGPGSNGEKVRLINFFKEKTQFDQLSRKFNVLGKDPTIQEIDLHRKFLEDNASELTGDEKANAILASRSAIDEFEINYPKGNGKPLAADTRTDQFIKETRSRLDGMMKSLPGFENVNSADYVYHETMQMASKLDKSLQGEKEFGKFLKETFDNAGSVKSNENLAAIDSLSEKLGQKGLLETLNREYQIREAASNTKFTDKFDFENEFADKAKSEHVLRGLFYQEKDNAIARYNLEKLKKIPGMKPVIDDAFRNFAGEYFKTPEVLSKWETKAQVAEVAGLASYPFSHIVGSVSMGGGFLYTAAMRLRYPTVWASFIKSGRRLAQTMAQPLAINPQSLLLGESMFTKGKR